MFLVICTVKKENTTVQTMKLNSYFAGLPLHKTIQNLNKNENKIRIGGALKLLMLQVGEQSMSEKAI